MPRRRRLIAPWVAPHLRSEPAPPKREVWTERFENDMPRLVAHRLYDFTFRHSNIKKDFEQPGRKFIAWEVFCEPKQTWADALIFIPRFWPRERTYRLHQTISFNVDFTPYAHHIGITDRHFGVVWYGGGGDRDHEAMGLLCHALDNTDPMGEPNRNFYGERHMENWSAKRTAELDAWVKAENEAEALRDEAEYQAELAAERAERRAAAEKWAAEEARRKGKSA